MPAAIQAQPPKPPPAPKVEAKAGPKPADAPKAAAQASPAPAKTPDLFEQASGGGRVLPSSGASSFTPAVTAAKDAVKDAVSNARSSIQGAVNNSTSNMASAFQGQIAQVDPFGAAPPGYEDPATSFMNFGSDFSDLGDIGQIFGGGAGQPVSAADRFFGGAPGGVSEDRFFSASDSINKNFAPVPGMSFAPVPWMSSSTPITGYNGPGFLSSDGGGSKPGLGGGGLGFLNQLGGGAFPVSSASQPSVTLPSTSGSSSSHGHRHFNLLSLLNFGNRGSGGGGAPGGVAEGRAF